MNDIPPTARTRVRRRAERGVYDRATIYDILDAGLICHVGIVEGGQPFVIPTIHARMGDRLLLHGAPTSRLLRTIKNGEPLCITVTLLDGLVLARSAMHHSMNFRSVVLLGKGCVIEDEDEKIRALRRISDHIIPGRWAEVRAPNEAELKMTMVVAIPIDEASAKIRTGPPGDDEDDYRLAVWAGVLPLQLTPQAPQPDARLLEGVSLPEYVTRYQRPNG
jgi:nitroimidazol reductase NimA-like FMN-containing flavoprotein (pyridoxamine 5'-phosphate oxidase superfamily)